jgi:hypothetical protein
MARARLWLMPTLVNKITVIFSLTPKPPIEIGRSVIAVTTGIKIKKYIRFTFTPKDRAII